jgi:hypothetical protein
MLLLKKLSSLLFIFLSLNCLTALTGSNRTMGLNNHVPNATIIRSEDYKILGTAEGETSTFFILGLYPLTNPPNIDYALSQAVQKIPGGDSMVNISIWQETHNIFPLGTVSVLKVKGDIVSFKVEEVEVKETPKNTPKKRK